MTTATLTRVKQKSSTIGPMQWRGSDDGIRWTPWHSLLAINQKVDRYFYYQARILIDGRWRVSKIEWD